MPTVTPRRPASAAVVSSKSLAGGKVESMIQAAHGHPVDRSCSPVTQRRRRDNQEETGLIPNEVVRVADHMDSRCRSFRSSVSETLRRLIDASTNC
ncbi:hypothetical protein PC129_g22964 [Phytophthora cactorum]|uniref:Uncharacterized protein n=1 Tax=Phytophthora cactorum TaxID=29920 RepID=A0A8T1AZU3_9STRA|nr:hypothetical protein PC112_g19780 [Phytophthora cactorum]KAG2887846.1 hypothetical protein PC114_g18647 [Phytophthora cactorum]KAG2891635.1 hypothetical protein PC115_g19121 [Phytophthora cactorum]KAG2903073.1 hypothetical protein PC117_g21330 [Phytophthora cactorum]KAG2958707.1 hypothetical protein PC118_g23385 [Phytophthora cactorum]